MYVEHDLREVLSVSAVHMATQGHMNMKSLSAVRVMKMRRWHRSKTARARGVCGLTAQRKANRHLGLTL